ncbi:MAG: hypothetical protein IH830_03495 [Planctomycetes bacterium]|nr:hypothetical protein [Planctomycetota bacterium]
MTLRPVLVVALLLAALTLPVFGSARRLGGVRTHLQAARVSLIRTESDAQRILELRAKQQRIAEHKRPQQDVIARVNTVLAESGIPLDRFGGLVPESDSALPGAGTYRRQSVRMTLNGLTIPRLGAFLAQWSDSQHLWTPTRIELARARNHNDPARYDVNIVIGATYIGEQ